MLNVINGFVEKLGDVIVVQAVDNAVALPDSCDEAQSAREAELMGDRRLFHPDGFGQFRHAARALAQAREDHQPGRGGEGSTVLVGLNGLRLLRESAWRRAVRDA
ncbi:hypothetical protein GCM10009730_07090 [Streptomyces albidochromogenes]